MVKWLLGILATVISGLIVWFTTQNISSCSDFPVSEVTIDGYDEPRKVVSGKAILSSNKKFSILVFAGKNGGPHWLQGSSGSLFSEVQRKQIGDQWEASWFVPEIHVGDDVVEIHAVAIFPRDTNRFIAAGIPDPFTGNAIKIGSITVLPEPKRVSSAFDPTKR